MKLAPELKVGEVEEGEALKGEADEEMAVISSYLSTKDIVRSHKISPNKGMGMEWEDWACPNHSCPSLRR